MHGGSRDRLSWAVKIRTSRLYFSCWRTPSAMVVVAGVVARDPTMRSTTMSSLPAPPMALPTAPKRDEGGPALVGLLLQLCWICLAYLAYAFRLGGGATNRVEHSVIWGITCGSALKYHVEQLK